MMLLSNCLAAADSGTGMTLINANDITTAVIVATINNMFTTFCILLKTVCISDIVSLICCI